MRLPSGNIDSPPFINRQQLAINHPLEANGYCLANRRLSDTSNFHKTPQISIQRNQSIINYLSILPYCWPIYHGGQLPSILLEWRVGHTWLYQTRDKLFKDIQFDNLDIEKYASFNLQVYIYLIWNSKKYPLS